MEEHTTEEKKEILLSWIQDLDNEAIDTLFEEYFSNDFTELKYENEI